MTIYALLKYNGRMKAWEVIRQYRTFMEVIGEITEEDVYRIKWRGKIHNKKDIPGKEMHRWTKVLLTKDLDKMYLTTENNLYRIKSFEIY